MTLFIETHSLCCKLSYSNIFTMTNFHSNLINFFENVEVKHYQYVYFRETTCICMIIWGQCKVKFGVTQKNLLIMRVDLSICDMSIITVMGAGV